MKGKKILLAEDTPASAMFIEDVLLDAGYQVVHVENGVDAVEQAEAFQPDLILMDVQMPLMDGITAVEEIRREEEKRGGHIPIIALTAHAMEEDRLDFLAKGFDGYVAKPMRMGDLFKEMKRCLDEC